LPCKKKKSKRRTTRKQPQYTQALKVVDTGIKATVGVAALGITATALTNLKPT
jgi:hypothetical protein